MIFMHCGKRWCSTSRRKKSVWDFLYEVTLTFASERRKVVVGVLQRCLHDLVVLVEDIIWCEALLVMCMVYSAFHSTNSVHSFFLSVVHHFFFFSCYCSIVRGPFFAEAATSRNPPEEVTDRSLLVPLSSSFSRDVAGSTRHSTSSYAECIYDTSLDATNHRESFSRSHVFFIIAMVLIGIVLFVVIPCLIFWYVYDRRKQLRRLHHRLDDDRRRYEALEHYMGSGERNTEVEMVEIRMTAEDRQSAIGRFFQRKSGSRTTPERARVGSVEPAPERPRTLWEREDDERDAPGTSPLCDTSSSSVALLRSRSAHQEDQHRRRKRSEGSLYPNANSNTVMVSHQSQNIEEQEEEGIEQEIQAVVEQVTCEGVEAVMYPNEGGGPSAPQRIAFREEAAKYVRARHLRRRALFHPHGSPSYSHHYGYGGGRRIRSPGRRSNATIITSPQSSEELSRGSPTRRFSPSFRRGSPQRDPAAELAFRPSVGEEHQTEERREALAATSPPLPSTTSSCLPLLPPTLLRVSGPSTPPEDRLSPLWEPPTAPSSSRETTATATEEVRREGERERGEGENPPGGTRHPPPPPLPFPPLSTTTVFFGNNLLSSSGSFRLSSPSFPPAPVLLAELETQAEEEPPEKLQGIPIEVRVRPRRRLPRGKVVLLGPSAERIELRFKPDARIPQAAPPPLNPQDRARLISHLRRVASPIAYGRASYVTISRSTSPRYPSPHPHSSAHLSHSYDRSASGGRSLPSQKRKRPASKKAGPSTGRGVGNSGGWAVAPAERSGSSSSSATSGRRGEWDGRCRSPCTPQDRLSWTRSTASSTSLQGGVDHSRAEVHDVPSSRVSPPLRVGSSLALAPLESSSSHVIPSARYGASTSPVTHAIPSDPRSASASFGVHGEEIQEENHLTVPIDTSPLPSSSDQRLAMTPLHVAPTTENGATEMKEEMPYQTEGVEETVARRCDSLAASRREETRHDMVNEEVASRTPCTAVSLPLSRSLQLPPPTPVPSRSLGAPSERGQREGDVDGHSWASSSLCATPSFEAEHHTPTSADLLLPVLTRNGGDRRERSFRRTSGSVGTKREETESDPAKAVANQWAWSVGPTGVAPAAPVPLRETNRITHEGTSSGVAMHQTSCIDVGEEFGRSTHKGSMRSAHRRSPVGSGGSVDVDDLEERLRGVSPRREPTSAVEGVPWDSNEDGRSFPSHRSRSIPRSGGGTRQWVGLETLGKEDGRRRDGVEGESGLLGMPSGHRHGWSGEERERQSCGTGSCERGRVKRKEGGGLSTQTSTSPAVCGDGFASEGRGDTFEKCASVEEKELLSNAVGASFSALPSENGSGGGYYDPNFSLLDLSRRRAIMDEEGKEEGAGAVVMNSHGLLSSGEGNRAGGRRSVMNANERKKEGKTEEERSGERASGSLHRFSSSFLAGRPSTPVFSPRHLLCPQEEERDVAASRKALSNSSQQPYFESSSEEDDWGEEGEEEEEEEEEVQE